MFLTLMKSKIHRAMITEANLNYQGSITIDEALMKKAGIIEHEQVHVVNINNGNRFITYVISGKEDSGVICLNGAAARLVSVGDIIIIISYAMMDQHEAEAFQPALIFVDERNKPTE